MAEYTVTRFGKEYDVTADDPAHAAKLVDEHIQQSANTKAQTEFKDAPTWAKPFMAVDDLARTTADSLTFGGIDKLIGGDAAVETAARRSRMGGADIAGDVVAGMAVPTGVPAAVARVGGGPIVRGVTGLLTGTGTGAVTGGLQAAGHDRPVVEGAVEGGIGGAVGQAVGGAIRGGANKIAKWWQGASDTLPPPSTANVPGKAPNPARRVENAAYEAEKAGGTQAQTIAAFKDMNQKKLPADVLADIRNITHKDLGTKAADLTSKLGYGMGGAAPFTGFHSVPLAVAQAVTGPAIGASAKFASRQGTSEAVEQLRRKLLKIPKFEGPLSKKNAELIARGVRSGIIEPDGTILPGITVDEP